MPKLEHSPPSPDGERLPAPKQERARRAPRMLLALGLTACLLYLGVEVYLLSGELGFPLDDSWIHLQFARNLAAGNGLSFNPGELVPGSTAPLWTALISLACFLPGSPLVWVKLAGVVCYLAAGAVTYRLAAELGLAPRMATLAAALTLATSWLVWSALSGLEIPLFTLVSLSGMVFHLRERRDPARLPVSLSLFGIGFLLRPEAVLLAVLAVADRWLVFDRAADGSLLWRPPRLRPVALGVALFVLLAAPVLLFNYEVSGSVLPTTFGAKSRGLQQLAPETTYLFTVLSIFFRAQPWMTLFAGAGALVLLGRLGGQEDRGLLPALWLLGLPCVYGLIDPPGRSAPLVGNLGRYFFPLFPLIIILGALAIQHLLSAGVGRLRAGPSGLRLRALGLVVLVLPTAFELVQGAYTPGTERPSYGRNVVNVQDSDVRAARWLSGRLPPEALLAVADIGAIKFHLPNRVIDLAGIASPEVRALGRRRFVEHHQPDYLIIFTDWYARVFTAADPFVVIREFPIADNVTMGGDTLALYSTPWTRYALSEKPSASVENRSGRDE